MTQRHPGGVIETALKLGRAKESLRQKEDSLLESVAVPYGPLVLDQSYFKKRHISREAEKSIRPALDLALRELNAAGRKDREAFNRFCNALRQCFETHPEASDLTHEGRHALMGLYFDAGMKGKRKAGRPELHLEGLFVRVWHAINLELQQKGKPLLTGKVPAKEIAARCAREGLGEFNASHVSDALRERKRTLSCPYYGKNTGD